MAEQKLIYADKLIRDLNDSIAPYWIYPSVTKIVEEQPSVDAVPIKVIESWLYSIALNNTDNYLGDACEEIIKRLGGLERYNAERKDGEHNEKGTGCSDGYNASNGVMLMR